MSYLKSKKAVIKYLIQNGAHLDTKISKFGGYWWLEIPPLGLDENTYITTLGVNGGEYWERIYNRCLIDHNERMNYNANTHR